MRWTPPPLPKRRRLPIHRKPKTLKKKGRTTRKGSTLQKRSRPVRRIRGPRCLHPLCDHSSPLPLRPLPVRLPFPLPHFPPHPVRRTVRRDRCRRPPSPHVGEGDTEWSAPWPSRLQCRRRQRKCRGTPPASLPRRHRAVLRHPRLLFPLRRRRLRWWMGRRRSGGSGMG